MPQEVTVNRQVLADPALLGPDVQVWARLQDGTPLVPARKLGEGGVGRLPATPQSRPPRAGPRRPPSPSRRPGSPFPPRASIIPRAITAPAARRAPSTC